MEFLGASNGLRRRKSVAFASPVTLDFDTGDVFDLTLTGNTTLNCAGGHDGQPVLLRVKQDGTGSRTVTLGTMIRLGSDITALTLSTAAGKTDYVGLVYHATDDKYDLVSFARGY